MKRVFLIVLDSVGAGEAPDAAQFNDTGSFTLKSVFKSSKLSIPNLVRLGIGNIDGLSFLGETNTPVAALARLSEKSAGKDTTVGHWEIAGHISGTPLPTYPNGFPEEVISLFEKETGHKVICNLPYSGTDVIRDYGEEHLKTGNLIVYTSADSVFQIAAHTDLYPIETLYEYCTIARKILSGKHAVGRVIARPFSGKPGSFYRTADRRDFSLEPTGTTLLDNIVSQKLDVLSVGKIYDIFAGVGITDPYLSHGNPDCMKTTLELAHKDFKGLCFVNLVDFDMVYGHRNDVDGYANALTEFDKWLSGFIPCLGDDDCCIITADHGCDPGDISTDHTREYTPMLAFGKQIKPVNLHTRKGFCDIAATIADLLNIPYTCEGTSFAKDIL